MSDGEAPRATTHACPHCGRQTTAGRFCIHCGQDTLPAAVADTMAGPRTERERDPVPTREQPVLNADGGTLPSYENPAFDRVPEVDRRIGLIVGGRYRVESVIGQGGFGTVYRGTHLEIGEPVAIKFLHAELAGHTELRARFRREAKALARLRHPGIVSVHDFGEEDGTLYLVMELVSGQSLQKHIVCDGQPMALGRIAKIFDEILQVLEAAHALDIVHRDMKPENVLLLRTADRTEHVKVLDFGIALMKEREGEERLTATGVVQGTPLYMSPEQCRGRDVGPKADVYAVGVMLYEALTAEPPFVGQSATDLMVKHMFIDPPPMKEKGVKREVPPGVEAAVRRALAKKIDVRPTAAELRDALAAAFAGTDAASFSAAAQAQKAVAVNLSREERGLPPSPGGASTPVMVTAAEQPRVILWRFEAARAEALIAALGGHGVRGVVWSAGDPPPAVIEEQPVRCVVLAGTATGSGGGTAADRIVRLRGAPATARVPALVVDLAAAEDTPTLIRAGASDVTLALVGDDAICKKIERLVKRGR